MTIRYPLEKRAEASFLRKSGWSIEDIAKKLNIAKSTSYTWLKDFKLDRQSKEKFDKRVIEKKIVYAKKLQNLRDMRDKKYLGEALKITSRIKERETADLAKIYVALLYWAEGAKFSENRLEFTNSDPKMIAFFLKHLRFGFDIKEEKLRANIHLHEYHDPKKQTEFWHKITQIPVNQFTKFYIKTNTKKTIRKDYPGCVRICYYEADISRQIKALYLACSKI